MMNTSSGEEWKPGDFENYKETMASAVLSGKDADIVEAGSLPIGEFVGKQLLVNLDEYISKDSELKKDDLQLNALEAFKHNGGMYAMPEGYFIRTFIGDGDILGEESLDDRNWTWKEFAEKSKKWMQKEQQASKSTRYALANDPPVVILQEMVVDSYSDWVDRAGKKAAFDKPEFIEMMQNVKKMYEEGVATSEPADLGEQLFYSTVLRSPSDFIEVPHTFFSNPKLLNKPHNGKAGGMRIIPASQLAISTKSSVKEEAWRFIAFLLSEEVQAMQERQGFSFLKSVNEKQLADIWQQVNNGSYKLSSGKAVKVSEGDLAEFKEIVQKDGQFVELDGQILNIVGEVSTLFFEGQKSAEEAAKIIQERTIAYLNG